MTPIESRLGPARPAGGPASRPPGVLVVDDTAVVRSVLGAGLRASGFAVWVADGGRAGVALYLTYRRAIDVVLLDVRMPGWDGPGTLAAIRALGANVPCCFMIGDAGSYTEDDLRARGAVDVFRKPFRLVEVVERLRQIASS